MNDEVDVAITKVKRLRTRAKTQRKLGEALGLEREQEARTAFEQGVGLLEDALAILGGLPGELIGIELAETYGSLGGMLQRLGEPRYAEALEAYEAGARIEEEWDLSSTYNRLNAIKFQLLTGLESFGALRSRLQDLADFIDERLREDSELSDSGWAWADFGDCQALLGNLGEARSAYATFISKAEVSSPARNLQVLRGLADSMEASGDPAAPDVYRAIDTLLAELEC